MDEIDYYIKLDVADVGKIDILVQEGLYKDRSDFIQKAIAESFAVHKATIDKFTSKNVFVLGWLHYSAKDLEKTFMSEKKLRIRVIGGISFDADVSAALISKTVESIHLAGILRAADEALNVLNTRRYSLSGLPYNDVKSLPEN